MGIAVSIFLIAVGAILKFAVTTATVGGMKLANVGIILMIVGALGLVVSFIVFSMERSRVRAASLDGRRTVVREEIR